MDVNLGLEIMTVAIETIDGPYKDKIEEILKTLDNGGYFEIPTFDSVEDAIFYYEYDWECDEGFASVDGDLYYIYWDTSKEGDHDRIPLLIS